MKDLMLDLETMGTKPNSVITQIGLCLFDIETGVVGPTFQVSIDIQSALDLGLTVTGGSIEFWLGQPGRSFLKNRKDIETALVDLWQWVKRHGIDAERVWAHENFDFPILDSALRAVRITRPWHYKEERDIRTLVDLAELDRSDDVENSHDALEDCLYQVRYVSAAYRKLKGLQ